MADLKLVRNVGGQETPHPKPRKFRISILVGDNECVFITNEELSKELHDWFHNAESTTIDVVFGDTLASLDRGFIGAMFMSEIAETKEGELTE